MVSYWVFALMAIAAVYSIIIFIIQLVRYFKHRTSETELLDQETDEDSEEDGFSNPPYV